MSKQAKGPTRFLKHPVSGVVFAETPVLKKMRKDLLPCTRTGMLLQRENIDMPMLFNPFTGKLVPNSGDNSSIIGLIPVRDELHAAQIKASLMGGNTEPVTVSQGEPAETDQVTETSQTSAPAPTATQAHLSALREVDVYEMDKPDIQAFVAEHFPGEKLDGRSSVDMLREQLQVIINNHLLEAQAA